MSVLELALNERIRRDYSAEGMEELFVRLDLLHDYASAGQLQDVTPLSRATSMSFAGRTDSISNVAPARLVGRSSSRLRPRVMTEPDPRSE